MGAAGLLAASGAFAASAGASPNSFIGGLTHTKLVASTTPQNGDINPYGVAVVPGTTGDLQRGDVLVSNFNNSGNTQGTGTTIVQVSPHGGPPSLFAQITDSACPGGVGLTTALVALPSGWVIVGSLPTQGGAISGPGCLIVLDQWGHVRKTITGHGIDGPWDMTSVSYGGLTDLFVTNVLGGILGSHPNANGGTVQRLLITSSPFSPPSVLDSDTIGSGFPARTDINALVIGPTGAGLGPDGTLYVADTLSSRIAAIPNALFRDNSDGTGRTVFEDTPPNGPLNGPLGLAIAPNGNILTVNSGGGNLFGLAVKPGADAVYFVDDFSSDNNLQLLF